MAYAMLIGYAKVHTWRNNKPTNPTHRQVTDYTVDDVLREIGPGLLDGIATIAGLGRPDALVQPPATRCRREVPATSAPATRAMPIPDRDIHGNVRRFYVSYARMFWGTDITRISCSWRKCVMLFTAELSWLSPSGKSS